jgi:uncharacterized OsmC-like protein
MSVSSPSCIMMAEPTVINGVNVTALMETVAAVKRDPQVAHFNFRATNKWLGGDRNRTTIQEFTGAKMEHRVDGRPFVYDNGEPDVLLGRDAAPNPAEWLLHSLIGCMTTTTAYHAAARGIEIRSINSEIDGDLDLRGFLGMSDKVRKGYTAIRVKMRVATPAKPDMIEQLTRMSPVLDVVSQSVPVSVSVETY